MLIASELPHVRTRALLIWGAAILMSILSQYVFAQRNGTKCAPDKMVRLIVPASPGGEADLLARLVAPSIGVDGPLIVDNRPGANGTIATDIAAKAPPDGFTILLGSVGPIVYSQFLFRNLPYDSMKDLMPMSQIASGSLAIVVPTKLQVQSLKDLIAFAKARPGEVSFGSSGYGSTSHFASEFFAASAGIKLIHVPFKGVMPVVTEVIGGQISLAMVPILTAKPQQETGKVRILAVTGAKRSAAVPNFPTVAEAGLTGYEVTIWYGLFGQAQMAPKIVVCYSGEIKRILDIATVKEELLKRGLDPAANTPEQFATFIKSEIGKWSSVVKHASIKPEL